MGETVKALALCGAPHKRRGFDSLLAEAKRRCHSDPFTRHLFIFVGKRKHHIKVLFWQSGGLCVLAKRLVLGCFRLPKVEPGQQSVHLAGLGIRWVGGAALGDTDVLPTGMSDPGGELIQ